MKKENKAIMNKAFIDKIEKHTYGGINLLELDHDSQKHTLKLSESKLISP